VHAIKVEPFGEGWSVSLDGVTEPQVFRGGRSAERAARSMGERLAAAGVHVEISIYLRDGTRASRFVCAPALT
jgi:hypothetical protein